jgi:hypothetical protein
MSKDNNILELFRRGKIAVFGLALSGAICAIGGSARADSNSAPKALDLTKAIADCVLKSVGSGLDGLSAITMSDDLKVVGFHGKTMKEEGVSLSVMTSEDTHTFNLENGNAPNSFAGLSFDYDPDYSKFSTSRGFKHSIRNVSIIEIDADSRSAEQMINYFPNGGQSVRVPLGSVLDYSQTAGKPDLEKARNDLVATHRKALQCFQLSAP